MSAEREKSGVGFQDKLVPIEKGSHGVEFNVWMPEKMPGAGEPIGVHKQEIEVGKRVFELSYLLGARDDREVQKKASADSLMVVTASLGEYSLVVMEVVDYLTMHKDTRKEWKSEQEDVLGREANFEGADSAGNWLMRQLVKQDRLLGFSAGLKTATDWLKREGKGKFYNEMTLEHQLPVMEAVMAELLERWLVSRNESRWEEIKRYFDKKSYSNLDEEFNKWHHHWLNGAIGMSGVLVGPGNNIVYGKKLSLADVMAASGVRAVMGEDRDWKKYGMLDSLNLFIKGDPGRVNVNAVVDLIALEHGGLTVKNYDWKTGPEGAFMTWGPTSYKNLLWRDYVEPRSDMVVFSEFANPGMICLSAGSDGGVVGSRDETERLGVDLEDEFSRRGGILLDQGPEALLNEVVDDGGKTEDDFLLAVVSGRE